MADYPKDVKLKDGDDLIKVKEMETMFQSAKDARKHLLSRWRRNEELYTGKILKPFNLPKYKTRIEPNIIHSVIETMYSILTDRYPQVDVMPRKAEQMVSAKTAQDVLNFVMQDKKATRAIAQMKRDGLIYGTGYIKPIVQNDDLEFIVPDPFTVFVDPLATNMQDAKCVIFATPTYIDDIEEIYGKRVAVEGKMDEYKSFNKNPDKYGTDKFSWGDVETQGPTIENEDGDYRGGMAILKESWYYDNNKLMLCTWAGNVLLQAEEAPYDFIPLCVFQNYNSAHSFYGKGEPEIIESLAVGAAIALSQGMDNLIYHGNPAIVMSKSLAKIQGNRPSDKPGQIYYLNNPSEQIQRLPAGNISSSTLPMAESMMGLADQVSGVHEISRGFNPTGVTAGKAISQLQEASQQIIRAKEREIGTDAVIDLNKMTLELLSKNVGRSISIRREAEDGSGYEFDNINPYDLDPDLDFKYVPGSSMPESRVSRMDQAIDLLQLGLLDEADFWRWTQGDITKDKMEKIAEQQAQAEAQMQQEMAIMQNSTDEGEIMDALLRQREMSGMSQQTEEANIEQQKAAPTPPQNMK
tara:strand:+ start:273 stop:2012 length:1740 start_codon:yes stop_codon:yes gene_type:complete